MLFPPLSCFHAVSEHVSEAVPENFRRSKEGDQLIRQQLQKLLILEQAHFGEDSLRNADGRIKIGEDFPSWESLKQMAPTWISTKLAKIRSRVEFGKSAHAYFELIHSQLCRTPPCRKEFVQFLHDIHRGTVPAVGGGGG